MKNEIKQLIKEIINILVYCLMEEQGIQIKDIKEIKDLLIQIENEIWLEV